MFCVKHFQIFQIWKKTAHPFFLSNKIATNPFALLVGDELTVPSRGWLNWTHTNDPSLNTHSVFGSGEDLFLSLEVSVANSTLSGGSRLVKDLTRLRARDLIYLFGKLRLFWENCLSEWRPYHDQNSLETSCIHPWCCYTFWILRPSSGWQCSTMLR